MLIRMTGELSPMDTLRVREELETVVSSGTYIDQIVYCLKCFIIYLYKIAIKLLDNKILAILSVVGFMIVLVITLTGCIVNVIISYMFYILLVLFIIYLIRWIYVYIKRYLNKKSEKKEKGVSSSHRDGEKHTFKIEMRSPYKSFIE